MVEVDLYSQPDLQIRSNTGKGRRDSTKINETNGPILIQKRIIQDFSPLNHYPSFQLVNEYDSSQTNQLNAKFFKNLASKENLSLPISIKVEDDILSKYVSSINIGADQNLQENQKNQNNIVNEEEHLIKLSYIKKQHRFPYDDFEILRKRIINSRRNLNVKEELQALKNNSLKLTEFKVRNKKDIRDSEASRSYKEALQYRILVSLDTVIIDLLFCYLDID